MSALLNLWGVLPTAQQQLESAPGPTRSHQVSPGPWVLQILPGLTKSFRSLGPPGSIRSHQVSQDPTRSLDAPGPTRSHHIPPGLTRSSRTCSSLGTPGPTGCHQIPPGLTKSFLSLGTPGVRSHHVPPSPISNLSAPGPTRSHQILWVLQVPGPTRSHQVPSSSPCMLQIPPDLTRSHQVLQVPRCSTSLGSPHPTALGRRVLWVPWGAQLRGCSALRAPGDT